MKNDLQKKTNSASQSRRRFLQDSSLMMAGGLSLSRAAHGAGDNVIRAGLVGCGRQGIRISQELLRLGHQVEIRALADAFGDRLQAAYRGLRSRFGKQVQVPLERRFVGLNGLTGLLESDVDLVVLATPPAFRPAQMTAAFGAGKHVFAEPPLAVDVAGVDQLLSANEHPQTDGLCIDVGFQRRHEDRYVSLARRIAAGAIGDVRCCQFVWIGNLIKPTPRGKLSEFEHQLRNWQCHRWLGGNPMLEKQIHSLDFVNWFLQESPLRVQLKTGSHTAGSDSAELKLVYPSVVVSSRAESSARAGSRSSECVVGTQGSAQLDAGIIRDRQQQVVWKSPGGGGSGAPNQLANLIEAIQGARRLNRVESGAFSTLTALLGHDVNPGEALARLVALSPGSRPAVVS